MIYGLVSVIVPIRRGEDKTVISDYLQYSSYEHCEIITINAGEERSKQRNIGMALAQGEYLLFLDSDQYVSTDLISECVRLCQSGFDAIYIPEIILGNGFFTKVRNFERQFYNGTPIDAVRFVRKDCCQSFDERMTGPEDADWDRRVMGERMTAKNVIYHNDQSGFCELCRKKAYYSKSMRLFYFLHPGDEFLSLKYRYWTVFTENGKWLKLLTFPGLAICMYFSLFVRGVIYLCRK